MSKRGADTQLTKEKPDQPDQSDPLAARWWAWTPDRRNEELHRLHTALSVPGGSLDERREWQRQFDAYRQMEETPPVAAKATAAQMASRKVAPAKGLRRRGGPTGSPAPQVPLPGPNPFGGMQPLNMASFPRLNQQPQQSDASSGGLASGPAANPNQPFTPNFGQSAGNAENTVLAPGAGFTFGMNASQPGGANPNGGPAFGGPPQNSPFNFTGSTNTGFQNPFEKVNGAPETPQLQFNLGAALGSQGNPQNNNFFQSAFGQPQSTSGNAQTTQTSSLFTPQQQQQPPATAGGFLGFGTSFGQTSANNNNQNNLFGSATSQPQQTASQPGSNMFGGSFQQSSAQDQSSTFALPGATQPSSNDLFGGAFQQTSSQDQNNIFAQNTSQAPNNLFGRDLQLPPGTNGFDPQNMYTNFQQPLANNYFSDNNQQPSGQAQNNLFDYHNSLRQPQANDVFSGNGQPSKQNQSNMFDHQISYSQQFYPQQPQANEFFSGNAQQQDQQDQSNAFGHPTLSQQPQAHDVTSGDVPQSEQAKSSNESQDPQPPPNPFASNFNSEMLPKQSTSGSYNFLGAGNDPNAPSNDTSSSGAFSAFAQHLNNMQSNTPTKSQSNAQPADASEIQDVSMHSIVSQPEQEQRDHSATTPKPSDNGVESAPMGTSNSSTDSSRGMTPPGNAFFQVAQTPKASTSTLAIQPPAPPAPQTSVFSGIMNNKQTFIERPSMAPAVQPPNYSAQPSSFSMAATPSSYTNSAMQKSYKQLTPADWNALSKNEKLTVLNCALKAKLAEAKSNADTTALVKKFLEHQAAILGSGPTTTSTAGTYGSSELPNAIDSAPAKFSFNPSTSSLFSTPSGSSSQASNTFASANTNGNKRKADEDLGSTTKKSMSAKDESTQRGGFQFPTQPSTSTKRKAEGDWTSSSKKQKDDSRDPSRFASIGSTDSPPKSFLGFGSGFGAPASTSQPPASTFSPSTSITPPSGSMITPSKSSSQTSTLFKNLLDKQDASQASQPSSNLFGNKPTTDAAPSAPNMTSSSTTTSGPFSFTPLNKASFTGIFSTQPTTNSGNLYLTVGSSSPKAPTQGGDSSPADTSLSTTVSKSLNGPFSGSSKGSIETSTKDGAPPFGGLLKGLQTPGSSKESVETSDKDRAPTLGGFPTGFQTTASGTKPAGGETISNKTGNGSLLAPTSEGKGSLFSSRNVSPAPSGGSVFDSRHLGPTNMGKSNIFGHLSDVDSAAESKKGDADDEVTSEEQESEAQEGDGDEEGEEGSEQDGQGDDDSEINGEQEVVTTSTVTRKRKGPFADEDEESDEDESVTPPKRRRSVQGETSGTTTPGRSLFDRISYGVDGKPEREIRTNKDDDTTPKTSTTSNLFGMPSSTSKFGNSILQNKTNSPAGDHTWKPDSPIKFNNNNTTSTTASMGSNDKENTDASTAATDPSKSLSTLFGTTSGASSTLFPPATSKPDTTGNIGFGFGIPPPTGSTAGSSLFPPSGGASLLSTPGPSAITSRATTPGVSGGESTADGEEEPGQLDPQQGDLLGLGKEKEGHDVLFETAKASAYVPEDKLEEGKNGEKKWVKQWVKKGLGPVLVLKDRETGVSKILMKTTPAGRVVINTRVSAQGAYRVQQAVWVNMVVADKGFFNLRFGTAADAVDFVDACT